MLLVKRTFEVDGLLVSEGYDTGDSWNGWSMPVFNKEQANIVIQRIADETTTAWYSEQHDAFVVVFSEDYSLSADDIIKQVEADIDYEPTKTSVEVYKCQPIDNIPMYPIGSGSWCWELA